MIDRFLSYFISNKDIPSLNVLDCKLNELNFISDKYLAPFLTYIKENKEVFATALSNGKSFGFEKIYSQLFENIFNPILERFHYPDGDRKYVMRYYLNGIIAIVTEWLKEDCQKPIPELSRIIRECIFGHNNQFLKDI
jgi:hypothetical protein